MDLINKRNITLFLLVSSYLAAILVVRYWGYHDFLRLTPFNLLMSLGLLVWNHAPQNAALWRFLTVSWIVGFAVEVVGVNTGLLFGAYWYGDVLGWKVWGTPLLIGANWAIVVYCSNEMANRLWRSSASWAGRVLTGGVLTVALDWLIEPVAIRYGMWHWAGGTPPLQNYIAWFVVATALAGVYHVLIGKKENLAAPVLLILQVIFFMALR